ncbi:M4 family metallopeptidase [Pyxidicoccus parkwayensis]|uniref:Neutral metalloproteinase n=1 Tax=Pyxidicoccus parkwayensis TaxID=2813578 RepID=A0ABX7PAU7_9BACT|nr:M4 family metallopeptidase [Pyxidicoccus parkwaysis]QSQ27573.1 M4 family metallopeptidase [Pyxidicoccus parkwaysis]
MHIPTRHRHSIHCILPPHLTRQIAVNGTKEQRERLLRTLSIDHTFRSMRVARAGILQAGQQLVPSPMVVESQLQRTIYDMKNTEALPGTVVRTEGQGDTSDVAVNEAYAGLGDTYALYWEVFARNSIDGKGLPLHAHVHYGSDYNNAFWDGERMIFGDGDGDLFNRFTIAVDVIGHELTHGVTECDGPLTYFTQSGALNESISDVFGSIVKQRTLNQKADQADWLIGEGLFTKKVQGVALRSMKAPGTAYDDPVLGKDPQPARMRDYVRTVQDNGGVHINSGIPNRAFYLVASELGGYSWERAGHIWYETLRDPRLRANSTFLSFARLTVLSAARLYGSGGAEEKAVRDAWAQVDIRVSRERAGEPMWGPGVQLPSKQPGQRPPAH